MSTAVIRVTLMQILLCGVALSQASGDKPTFEVASVKLIKTEAAGDFREGLIATGRMYVTIDDARVDLGAITLGQLIQMAYRVPQRQVVGPDWLGLDLFDIHAKIPPGTSKDHVPEMLQTLLAERFSLAVHHDQRMIPVYALKLAKSGPKFQKSKADSEPAGCSFGNHRVCRGVTMEQLARTLSVPAVVSVAARNPGLIDRVVVDMTGLEGRYDFTMDYSSTSDTDTAFEAVKALGLRLEPTQKAYDYVIIDRVERVPTAN